MGKRTLTDRVIELTTGVATLSERVNNLITHDDESHTEILTKIDSICEKVNHQHSNHEKRIQSLELHEIADTNKYKGRMELFKWTTALLSAALTIVGILSAFKVI